MIHTEFYITREDGVNLYRTYSDNGFRIKCIQTNAIYDEAVDVDGSTNTYEETSELIPEEITDSEALDILLGRVTPDDEEGSGEIPQSDSEGE